MSCRKSPVAPTLRLRGVAVVLCLALLLQGCAIFYRRNTPVFEATEKYLVPKNEVLLVATLPLTFPLGLLALAVDQFIVRPVLVFDDALDDAAGLWRNLDWQEDYVAEVMLSPWRLLGSGIVFTFSYLGRIAFDLEAATHPDPGLEPPVAVSEEPPAEPDALEPVRETIRTGNMDAFRREIAALSLENRRAMLRDLLQTRWYAYDPTFHVEALQLAQGALARPDEDIVLPFEVLNSIRQNPNPLVRHALLDYINTALESPAVKSEEAGLSETDLLRLLSEMAANDASSPVAWRAGEILREYGEPAETD